MRYRTILLVTFNFCALVLLCQNQIELTKIDTLNLPKGLKSKGKILDAVRWTDKSGDNVVITSETGEYQSKSNNDTNFHDAELFAFHFLLHGDSFEQTWEVYDFIKDCPLDIEAYFVKNTFQVTDLNNDYIAEIWLMYKTVCHGDVSPSKMKIIMYEGLHKYIMFGENMVQVSVDELNGGEYKFDASFEIGPSLFRKFAKILWEQNIFQTWE